MKKAFNFIFFKFIFSASIVIFAGVFVFAQRVEIKPFTVAQTNLIDDLKKVKIANPKMTAEEFVKTANSLLEKKGMNFVFALDAATCQKIEQAKKTRKDPNLPLNLRTALKSVTGEAASLQLPEPSFDKSECVPCYVSIPVLEVNEREFTTIVEGNNIKFHLPQNFTIADAALVDEKDLTTVKTKWKLPFRTAPLSISKAGDILYIGFNETELSDLVLLIYAEGGFQFDARKNINPDKKPIALKNFPKDSNNSSLDFVQFETANNKQIVRFSRRCEN